MKRQPTLLDPPARRGCSPDCRPPAASHAHCGACHRTFGSVTDFDKHRDAGHCLHPATLGLVDKDGLWASAERHANDERHAAHLAVARARGPQTTGNGPAAAVGTSGEGEAPADAPETLWADGVEA